MRPARFASSHKAAHTHYPLERVLNADTSFLEAVLQGVFTFPCEGATNYAPIFAVLREAGYAGWLVVEAEQDPAIGGLADPAVGRPIRRIICDP